MDNVLGELQEYVVIPTSSHPQDTLSSGEILDKGEYKWSVNGTKLLIDFYSKYKNKVGTFEVKTVKMMWLKISAELAKLNIHITANNCMNRWKVLERNYKKFVDNKNKIGRGRKFFEYEEEMNLLFGRKKNVHPELLLDSHTFDESLDDVHDEEIPLENIGAEKENTSSLETKVIPGPSSETFTPITSKKKLQLRKKASVLEKIREDRKQYYDARLEIERIVRIIEGKKRVN